LPVPVASALKNLLVKTILSLAIYV